MIFDNFALAAFVTLFISPVTSVGGITQLSSR
jgi:hypothetical protein